VVMGRHVKSLEFIDIAFGDRPALTPAETFYQRLLAGNREEALETAEAALADRTLLDYYDTVVLEALRHAADDLWRGALSRERAVAVTKAMLAVIHDLGEHEDAGVRPRVVVPQVGPIAGVVACVAGRSPLDVAVSAMLVQLLEQRGVPARRVSYAAVGRERIAAFDQNDIAVVVVLSVTLDGVPAHLRYLARRLRARLPRTPVVAGLWREGDALFSNLEARKTVGVDALVTSLGAAVEAAMTAVGPDRTEVVGPVRSP